MFIKTFESFTICLYKLYRTIAIETRSATFVVTASMFMGELTSLKLIVVWKLLEVFLDYVHMLNGISKFCCSSKFK